MTTPRMFEVLLTASEAYPRLEQEFLNAQSEVIAGFRIFDPWTKLRSDAGRAVGETWFDLIRHTLNRGVEVEFILTDFDPVARMDMHLYAWQCLRAILAAGEASNHPENLKARVAMHPARLGLLPRTALWMRSVKEVTTQLKSVLEGEKLSPADLLKFAPGVRPLVVVSGKKAQARRFPPPNLVPVTHHQKLAVFDGARLYIGGLDLNDRRYDTPEHRRDGEDTWHDVQVMVDGPVAAETRTHLLEMERAFNGEQVNKPEKLLRTISSKRRFALPYMSPVTQVAELAEAHLKAIERSEKLIYFETQFFRDENLARALAKRAEEAPDLTLVMILPAAPEDIAFTDTWGPDAAFGEHLQTKCLDLLFDGFGDRVFVGSPARPVTHKTNGRDTHYDAPIIYLHAKVSVFDDHTGIISSANLNGRSMNWDTEAGVQTETMAEVAQIKERCFSHWLGPELDAGDSDRYFNLDTACRAWADLAKRNAQTAPEKRNGLIVPYSPAKAEEDAKALPGVPPEMA